MSKCYIAPEVKGSAEYFVEEYFAQVRPELLQKQESARENRDWERLEDLKGIIESYEQNECLKDTGETLENNFQNTV